MSTPCVNRPLAGQLGPLLRVRPEEGALVVHLLGVFLLMGAGLAIGRGTTDALFFKRYGIEYLPVMYMVLSVLLAGVSTVYAAFVDRVPAERAYAVLSVVLAAVLGLSWWGMVSTEASLLYPAYFLIYEVASELLLVHGPLYLSQNLDTLTAKRLSPLVFAGAQVGTIAGGLFLSLAAPRVGVQNLLLAWVALLLAGLVLLWWWHRRHGASAYYRAPRKASHPARESLVQVAAGVRLTRESPLVRSAALALFFMVISFYVLCYSVNRIYNQAFPSEEALTAFFGALTAVTSLLSLLLQLLVTGRAIERFGLRPVHLVFPAVSLVSYVGLIAHFALPSALLASASKDAIMPAFRTPVRAMIFNVLPGSVQGRARAMSVMLVMPAALMVCGGMLWLVQRLENPLHFLVPGLLAAVAYLFYTHRVNRAYVGTLVAQLKARLTLPSERLYTDMRGSGEAVYEALERGVRDPDEQVAVSFARALAAAFPERAAGPMLARLRGMSHAGADQMVRQLPVLPVSLHGQLLEHARSADAHLKATVIDALVAGGAAAVRAEVAQALRDDNPRLAAAAVRGVLRLPVEPLHEEALAVWRRLLAGAPGARLAALGLISDLDRLSGPEAVVLRERYRAVASDLLDGPDEALGGRVLDGLAAWSGAPVPEIAPAVERLCVASDPRVRTAAVRCLRLLGEPEQRDRLALQALEDGHQVVRAAALALLREEAPDEGVAFGGLVRRWMVERSRGSPKSQATLLEALMTLECPRDALEAVATAKASDARALDRALQTLESPPHAEDPRLALIRHALRERVTQAADLALLALQPLAEGTAIAAIRAALRSGDARYRADACEALGNLDAHPAARTLADLLRGPEAWSRAADASGQFRDASDVLHWCAEREDPWLSACARNALHSLETRSATLESAIRDGPVA